MLIPRKIPTLMFAVALALGAAACEEPKGPAERAGEKIDDATHDAKAAGREAKEDIKDAAHDAKEGIKDAAKDAKEELKD